MESQSAMRAPNWGSDLGFRWSSWGMEILVVIRKVKEELTRESTECWRDGKTDVCMTWAACIRWRMVRDDADLWRSTVAVTLSFLRSPLTHTSPLMALENVYPLCFMYLLFPTAHLILFHLILKIHWHFMS